MHLSTVNFVVAVVVIAAVVVLVLVIAAVDAVVATLANRKVYICCHVTTTAAMSECVFRTHKQSARSPLAPATLLATVPS
jgi:hypothetical protein